jgi:hypothetical protein
MSQSRITETHLAGKVAHASDLPFPQRIGILNDYVRIPYANGSSFASQLLYREFSERGHDVTVIGPSDPPPGRVAQPDAALQYPLLLAIPADDTVLDAKAGADVERRQDGAAHGGAIFRVGQRRQRVAGTAEQRLGRMAGQFAAAGADRQQGPAGVHQAAKKHAVQAGVQRAHRRLGLAVGRSATAARRQAETQALYGSGPEGDLRHVAIA